MRNFGQIFCKNIDNLRFNNANQPKRILWVDFAKVIGIWLVSLGHLHIRADIIAFIFSFHMPLFFYISGYLEKEYSLKKTLTKGLYGLIIPYIILYGLSFLVWIPSRILWHKELFENTSAIKVLFLKPILGMLLGVGYDTNYSTMMNIPLWFLVGLFIVKILHKLFLIMAKNNMKIYFSFNVIIILVILLLKHVSIDLWFSVDSAFLAFPFFSLGYYTHKTTSNKILLEKLTRNKMYGLLIATAGAVIAIFLSAVNGRVDINQFNFGNNIFLFYITALFGISMVIGVSIIYCKNRFIINKIASGTVLILAFHGYAAAPIIRIIGMYSKELPLHIGIPISILCTLIMAIPIIFVQKYIPIILGGRK
jgi:fucose 4-O-acetylase-like acetyltransferase